MASTVMAFPVNNVGDARRDSPMVACDATID
jgi:hypothetical protein